MKEDIKKKTNKELVVCANSIYCKQTINFVCSSINYLMKGANIDG
ncbi:hypothetical protein [Clostridioides sp. ZZV15-6598]